MRKALTAHDVSWIHRQFKHPKPAYLIAELLRLCNSDVKQEWLRNQLIRKGLIPLKIGKGREHIVYYSRLKSLWPEFWSSARAAWVTATTRDEDDAA